MDRIRGQDRAVASLLAALGAGKLPHALVFHGPAGVGKCTTALALARVLLCHQRGSDAQGRPAACGQCASCKLLNESPVATPTTTGSSAAPGAEEVEQEDDTPAGLRQAHPDLHVVVKELAFYHDDKVVRDRKLSNIPTGVIEQFLRVPAGRRAQLGHGKVFIVDEADLMEDESQNRLLKTLEEPPAGTTIILVTDQEELLLPTVRSRAQRVAFVPLPRQVLQDWLANHAAVDKLAPTHQQWLLEFADGSLGRLKLAVDYDLVRWAREILPRLEELEHGEFVPDLGKVFHECINGLAVEWVERHDQASKKAANDASARLLLGMLTQWAQRRLRSAADKQPAAAPPAQAAAALEPWLEALDAIGTAQQQVDANINLGMWCDHLALHWFLALRRVAAH